MAVPKRISKFIGLKNLDVYVEDTTFDSSYFRVLECPSILTQGKSSFLIGGSDRLKPGVEVKLEICHNQLDEPIYTTPVRGHLEGDLRRVSIEVYEDVTPGPYTLYIVGELNPNTENVPLEWQGTYNVRWSKQISVNGMGVNTQPIYFYKQPSIKVAETATNYVEVPSSSATPIYLSGSGEPRQGTATIAPVENATVGGFGESTYPELDFLNKAKLSIIEENKPSTKLSGKQGLVGSKGQQVKTMSPVLDDYIITLSGTSTIDSLYVGHDIVVNNPQVDSSKFTLQSYHTVPTAYSSSVMKVLNSTSFVPKDVFYVYDNRTSPPTLEPAPLANTWPISASYTSLATQATSSINVVSYADMTISDLRTFSGDVHKLKVYAKSEGSIGDFEKIYDAALESSQVLYDKTEPTSDVNMGYFLDNTRLQNYWELYQGSDGSTSATVTYDATYINDSMKVSGSNREHEHSLRIQNKTAVDFIAGTLYSFKARVYGIKRSKKDIDGNISTEASLKVMTYGDAFNKTENTSAHWGDEKLSIPNMPDGVTEFDFGIVEGSFLADNTATGYIQLKVDSGEWYVSDIQVKSATDTAFNPDFVKINAPVPPLLQRPDRIRFLVEFYDVNNNIADSMIFSEPFDFNGPNINISGTDNILSGSMVIGSALGSGVEMAGVNSAFIRSIGYRGFKSGSGEGNNAGDGTYSGFMFYSGSVLVGAADSAGNGTESGDNYAGVGLELVGGSGSYLKFGTNPSELDIRTDAFFIGQEALQYMSGSESNIEISSSLFWLDPKNNRLIIGADAIINADLSVNSIFSPAGSTITDAKAAITSEGYAKFVSASIGAFKLNDDSLFSGPNDAPNFFISGSATGTEYFISSSNFQVRASGEVSASSLQLDGGSVGGLDVAEGTVSVGEILKLKDTGEITGSAVLLGDKAASQYLQYVNNTLTVRGDITVDSITTPATIAGAPSTVANASASITADGLATFKSGSIAGWKIFGSKLSGSNATLDADGAALYMSDKGPDTDDSAAFDILRDEYYIDFTPADQGNTTNYYVKFGPNFAIDSDGVLIASGAVFEGQITASTGAIGGANIESASLAYPPYWRISSSADVEDPASFISSSAFKVSAGGAVTGSNMLFNGGTIGGWSLSEYILQSVDANGGVKFDSENKQIGIRSGSHVDSTIIEFGRIGGTIANPKFGLEGLDTSGNLLFRLGEAGNEIAGWAISGSTISKAISGSAAYQDYTRVYMSSTNDNVKNITEGFTVYRKDEDIDNGAVKVVRVGGLSDTTNLHANNDYGLQVLQKDSNNNYSNLLYIGSGSQTLSGWNISTSGFVDSTGAIQLSSTQASMSLGTSGEVLIRGNSNSPYIALQPAVALASKNYAESGIFLGVQSGTTPKFSVVGTGGHIKFDGTDLDITAETVHFSGSNVTIATPTMFLGATGSAYISSSNGSMEISSSGLFVDADGNTTMQGTVTATGGTIGGFHINANNMWGGNAAIDNAATKIVFGQIQDGDTPKIAMGNSADDITLVGGTGLYVDGDGDFKIGSTTKYLKYTVSGDSMEVKAGALELDTNNIQISSTHASMSLGEGKLVLQGSSQPFIAVNSGSANQMLLKNMGADAFMTMGSKTSFSHEGSGTAGILIGMDASNPQAEFVKDSNNYFIFDDGVDIKTDTLKASGSNIILESPAFFMGATGSAFISGSNGNLVISASKFFLDEDGDVTASSVNFTGGAIAGWIINETNLTSPGGGVRLNGNGDNAEISVNSHTFGNAGIQLGYNSGNPRFYAGDGAQNFLRYDTSNGVSVKTTRLELDTTNIEISSTNASMSLGEGNILLDGANNKIKVGSTSTKQVEIVGSATQGYIATGKTNASDTTTGFWLANNNTDPEFNVGDGTNFIKFDGGDLDISSEKLEISASTLQVSTTQASMSLGHDADYPRGRIILDGVGTGSFRVGKDADFINLVTGSGVFIDGDGNFKFGDSDGGITFNDGAFAITGSDIDVNVTDLNINATGFQLSSQEASMSLGTNRQLLLKGGNANPYISLGMGGSGSYGTTGVWLAHSNSNNRPQVSFVGSSGHLKFDTGVDIETTTFELDASNVEISSTHASMSLGEGKLVLQGSSTPFITLNSGSANDIKLKTDGTDAYIVMGSKDSFSNEGSGTAGILIGMDAGNPQAEFVKNSSNYLIFDDGLDIKTDTFTLDTTHLDINSATKRIEVSDGSATRVRIGEVDSTSADHFGIIVFDGTGTAASDEIVHLSDAKYQIASWSLSPTQITSQNLILDSSGTIQTSDFASGIKGWRITSANNGEAEFEKVTVRGTLATTVFEKESVNAVGGQLYVANSTIYTGSAQLASTATTMSVANVGGFVEGEVLSAKKISSTGFATEYMYVESASRNQPSSDTDFSGDLYVIRGYSGSFETESGSVGDSPSTAQAYENGQVIVSTGKVGTGFIRLNANPNDTTTPYIDIVERTGSAIYDVELKARLGDLSGLSSAILHGNTNPGFGLATENVFLQGAITATTGSFTGIVWINTDSNNRMALGSNVDGGTNDGIYINASNYWYTDDNFRIGDATNYFQWDTSNLTIKPQVFDLSLSTLHISSSQGGAIAMGATAPTTLTDNGIMLSGSGEFNLQQDSSNYIRFTKSDGLKIAGDDISISGTDSSIDVVSFELDATDLEISSTNASMSLGHDADSDGGIKLKGKDGAYLAMGDTLPTDLGSAGIFMSASGEFDFRVDSQNFLKRDGSTLTLQSEVFNLGTETMVVSSSVNSGTIRLGTNGGPLSSTANTAGVYMDGTGKFQVFGDASNYIRFDSGTVDIKTDEIDIHAQGTNKLRLLADGSNTPSIALGTTLNTSVSGTETGIYMDGTGDFLAYGDSSNYLKFDVGGTPVLDIKATTAFLSGSQITLKSPNFFLGDTNNYISGSGGAIDIAADTFDLNTTNLRISSSLAGTIAMGSTLPKDLSSDGIMFSGSGDFNLQGDANNFLRRVGTALTVKAETFDLDSTTIVINSAANSGKIALGNTPPTSVAYTANAGFYVDGTGDFLVRADADNFIKVYSNTLQLKTETFDLDAGSLIMDSAGNSGAGTFRLGSGGGPSTPTADVVGIYMDGGGALNVYGDASNYLRIDGSTIDMRATTFYLSGSDITLKSPDFYLGDTSNYISGSGGNLAIYSTGNTTLSGSSVTIATPTMFLGATGSAYISASNGNMEISSSGLFVDAAGNTTMQGTVTATAGNIGGFEVDSSQINSSNDELILKSSGQITGSNVLFSGGKVGGWTLTANQLEANNIKINAASGYIEAGGLANVSDISDTSVGFFANKDGEVLIKAGTSANKNYMQFKDGTLDINTDKAHISGSSITLKAPDFYLGDSSNFISGSDGAINIGADTFGLGTATMIISSSVNNGTIRMGSAGGPLTVSANTQGIYMDGNGDFQVYGDADNYFRFDVSDQLKIAAETFDLQTTNLRVSSSYGGTVAMGSTIPKSISGSGVFLSGSGDFLAGNHSGNKIQYDAESSAIVMKSNTFSLDASTIVIDSSANNGKIALGASPNSSVAGTNSGIYMDGTGDFLAYGDADNFIKFDVGGSPVLEIKAEDIDLQGNNFKLEADGSSGTFYLGTITSDSDTTGAGVYMDSGGHFRAIGNDTNQLIVDGGSLTMKSDTFSLGTPTMIISSSVNNGTIRMGSGGGPLAHNTDAAGIYMDGQGRFQVYGDSSNYLRWDGSDFTIKGDLTVDNILTPATINGAPSTVLNASSSIDAGGFATFKSASIGGFVVTDTQINDDNSNLILKSSGQITASAARIIGDINATNITATSGSIANFTIATTGITSTGIGIHPDGQTYAFKAGSSSDPIPAFYVTHAGLLSASNANIAGGISASSGEIGGWGISSTAIHRDFGGGRVELRTPAVSQNPYMAGLAISDENDIDIVLVGSASNPFSDFESALATKWTSDGANFTDASVIPGDELGYTYFSTGKYANDVTPWDVDIVSNLADSGSRLGAQYGVGSGTVNARWTPYTAPAGNLWPPLGRPLGYEYGITRQWKAVGSDAANPTTKTTAGGEVQHNSQGTDDIVIGGSTQFTSGSIVRGSGNLSAISGPSMITSKLKNAMGTYGTVGDMTLVFTDNQNDTFQLAIDGVSIDTSMTYSTTPRHICDGIYVSWESAGSGTHNKGIWTVPIRVSGSVFYGDADGNPDPNGRTMLLPSGSLTAHPQGTGRRPTYEVRAQSTIDVGGTEAGHTVEYQYFVKRRTNPNYAAAVTIDNNISTGWGLYKPEEGTYDLRVNLFEKTGASSYNLIGTQFTKGINIPTQWTKKSLIGTIRKDGLYGNDLRVQYTASVDTSGVPETHCHYVDELRIASQSVYTSSPLVEMNQDGVLVYSSPSSYFKVDRDGLQLKSHEVTFTNVEVDEDQHIAGKLVVTGSFENLATSSISAGKQVWYNPAYQSASDVPFSQYQKTGSISIDSGSIDFFNLIRTGVTGSSHQYIRQSHAGITTAVDNTPMYNYGGPSMHFGEDSDGNTGFAVGTLLFSVPQRFGFGVRNSNKMQGYAPFTSEHKEPKAIMHVRNTHYWTDLLNAPMLALDVSGSTTNIPDSHIHFRTVRSIYPAGDRSSYPDVRRDWAMGVDGDKGVFKWSASDSGSYSLSDDHFMPTGIGTAVMALSSNANSSGTGRLGIGTEVPKYPLHVVGYDANSISIYAERDVAAYSDVRSKAEIETISGSLEIIKNIRGVTYRNKVSGSATGSRMMGVIAQELEPYLPEIVSTDGRGFKSVKYANLTALLIQGMKEQQEQIEELKQEIDEMKNG